MSVALVFSLCSRVGTFSGIDWCVFERETVCVKKRKRTQLHKVENQVGFNEK